MTDVERLENLKSHKDFLIDTIAMLAERELEVYERRKAGLLQLSATEAQIEKLEKELKETPKVVQ